jgi:hypothetical protein
MTKNIVGLFTGILFGLGLALSGMTQPQKVLNFLDVTGHWDPSLLFVLGGAVGVTVVTFRFILRRKMPVLGNRYYFSDKIKIDRPLVLGAALFGMGWGIAGYCPGPAVASMAVPNWDVLVFLLAMLLGIFIQKLMASKRATKIVVAEIAEQNDCS